MSSKMKQSQNDADLEDDQTDPDQSSSHTEYKKKDGTPNKLFKQNAMQSNAVRTSNRQDGGEPNAEGSGKQNGSHPLYQEEGKVQVKLRSRSIPPAQVNEAIEKD